MAEKSSQTEPCFQKSSRRWCFIHSMIHGVLCSIRACHIARQASPTIAGSGGRSLWANMVEDQSKLSFDRQPPIQWMSVA